MKFLTLLLATAATVTNALPAHEPTKRDVMLPPGVLDPVPSNGTAGPINDTVILNWLLHIQQTEIKQYEYALSIFNESDFIAANMPTWTLGRVRQMWEHEQSHAQLLSELLGPNRHMDFCEHTWIYNSSQPFVFVEISQVLEGLIAGAMIESLAYIQNKTLLPYIAQLIATESRHAAWVGSAPSHWVPWSGPFESPLTFGALNTQLAVHTVSCPDTNLKWPFKTYQMLMAEPFCHGCVMPNGAPLQLYLHIRPETPPPYYAAFVNGLNTTIELIDTKKPLISNITINGTDIYRGIVTIPDWVAGDVYVYGINSSTEVSDTTLAAGGFSLKMPFPSTAYNGGNI